MIESTKIVRKASTDEWVVQCYGPDGKRLKNADYFTSDKEDAKQTAKLLVEIWNGSRRTN